MSRQKGDTDIVMGAKSMCRMYYFFIYLAQHGECRELLVTLRISPQEVGQEKQTGTIVRASTCRASDSGLRSGSENPKALRGRQKMQHVV